MRRQQWTTKKLKKLYEIIKTKSLTFRDAAKEIGLSESACRSQWSRVDWDQFFENPDGLLQKPKKWDRNDLVLLYSLRKDASLDYVAIGKKMGRSPISCERKFQTTNWKDVIGEKTYLQSESIQVQLAEKKDDEEAQKKLVSYLIELSRYDQERLDLITEDTFLEKAKITKADIPCSYVELVDAAKHEFKLMGLGHPEEMALGEGTYLIVGDSHGKHTKRAMFSMLENLLSTISITNVIHVGHALDDDNDISFLWEKFPNLVILAKQEELRLLNANQFDYNIVRNEIHLGKLAISNQDIVQDYVPTFIGSISTQYFPDSVVLNSHRHEMDSRTTSVGNCLIASPGCLCEQHVVKTIKQIDFWDGKGIRVSYPDSYIKYRRMKHTCKLWEQGLLVVHVDKNGDWDIIPCRIRKTSKGFTTSYFNKIITSAGVFTPSHKIMFVGDTHCNWHDPNVLDIEEQFAQDYKPDTLVDVGDLATNLAFNHHVMERQGFAIFSNALKENAHTHFILKRRNSWAKKQHLLLGNHERFPDDLVEKFPQFADFFESRRMLDLDGLGVQTTDLLNVLRIEGAKFVHGDARMYGAKGTLKLEKLAQTFGRDTIMGHVHYPSIRYGCYSVGLSGLLDQDYNEPTASRWVHGFGFCNIFEGTPFTSLVSIQDYRCAINGKVYQPVNPTSWTLPPYDATMKFSFGQA